MARAQPQVFISYQRTDGEFARWVREHLARRRRVHVDGPVRHPGRRLDHALAIATAAREPFEAALTQLAQAELAIATGQVGDVRQLLAEARSVCEPLRAIPVLE